MSHYKDFELRKQYSPSEFNDHSINVVGGFQASFLRLGVKLGVRLKVRSGVGSGVRFGVGSGVSV